MPTYEEARQEYERSMGPELGTLYHLLWNQCALLHLHWDEYVELFGKDQEQFDVMNGVAPGFFKSVQDALWEGILLHLCRFADPAVVAHRKTLSLDALLKCPASKKVTLLPALVEDARKKIKFAQDWRNRSIAHLDLDYAIERSAKPLAPATRVHVREALHAIKEALQSVDLHFTGSGLGFGGTSWNWGGSRLLGELRLMAQLRREREERMDLGKGTTDDFDWKKWH